MSQTDATFCAICFADHPTFGLVASVSLGVGGAKHRVKDWVVCSCRLPGILLCFVSTSSAGKPTLHRVDVCMPGAFTFMRTHAVMPA